MPLRLRPVSVLVIDRSTDSGTPDCVEALRAAESQISCTAVPDLTCEAGARKLTRQTPHVREVRQHCLTEMGNLLKNEAITPIETCNLIDVRFLLLR